MTISENRIADIEQALRETRALLEQIAVRQRVPIDGQAQVVTVTQAAHGFAVGNAVRWTGSNWTKADGANGDKVGLVVQVLGTDGARICLSGRVRIPGGAYTPGSTYYLTTTPGTLTTTAPSWAGLAPAGAGWRPVAYAISATDLIVIGPSRQQVPGVCWGDLQIVSPTHPAGTAMSPLGMTADGFGTAWGLTAAAASGLDIVLQRNVDADVAGLHNPDDVEIALKLTDTGVTPGSYGGTTAVPILTVDVKGRITALSTAAISGTPTGPAGGDLTGTYPNPTIAAGAVGNTEISDVAASKVTGASATWNYDNTDTAAGNGVTVSGGFFGFTWTIYVKRPVWNAAFLQGNPVASTAPSASYPLTWNGSAWAPAQVVTAGIATGAVTDAKVTDVASSKITGALATWNYDNTDTAAGNGVTVSGGFFGFTWTIYVKRPVWNAAFLQSRAVANTAPDKYSLLKWDAAGTQWIPFALATTDGRWCYRDSTVAQGYTEIAAETPGTVLGRPSDTAGVPSATATPQIGTRPLLTSSTAGKLTVVVGTDGDAVVLGEASTTKVSVYDRSQSSTIPCVRIVDSTKGARVEIYDPATSTSVPLLVLDLADVSPTGGWSTAKALKLVEIDVCDTGVAKKMLMLGSATY